MKKTIIIIFLLVASINLTGCNSKLTEEDIKNKLEVNTEERTFQVNEVIYASDTITINDINMNVKDNTITLGDYTTTSNDENHKQITGYYDQSGAIYKIYRLSEDTNGKTTIWEMQKNETDPFNSVGWSNKFIENATDLILIECTETDSQIGQTPLKYQVYALVNNKLVQIK